MSLLAGQDVGSPVLPVDRDPAVAVGLAFASEDDALLGPRMGSDYFEDLCLESGRAHDVRIADLST